MKGDDSPQVRRRQSIRTGLPSVALLIFILLSSIYLLTYSGDFRVDDEHLLAARAQSLALRGGLSQAQVYGNQRLRALSELQPTAAAQAAAVEPLQAVLGAAVYRSAVTLGVGGLQALFLMNVVVTSLTGVVVFLIAARLDYDIKTSLACALLFGLASMAWPYSKTFFRDPLAALFTALAFLGWVILWSPQRTSAVLGTSLTALSLAAALFTKTITAVVLLALLLSVAVLLWNLESSTRRRMHKALVPLGLLMVLLIIIILYIPERGALARYSQRYLLSLLEHFRGSLQPELLLHSLGPFLSPDKSIFLYSPALILAPLAVREGFRRQRSFALPAWVTVVLTALAQALFYREAWAGTSGWGLRFMLIPSPLLAVLCAPIIEVVLAGGNRSQRFGLYMLFIVGFMVQVVGSTVAWNLPYQSGLDRGSISWPPFLPQVVHLSAPAFWDVVWLRLPWSLATGYLLLILVILVGLTTGLLAFLLPAMGRYSRRIRVRCIAGLLIMLTLLMVSMLVIGIRDPALGGDQPSFKQAFADLNGMLREGDVVVVDSYGTTFWKYLMNHWRSPVRWYALPYEIIVERPPPGLDLPPGAATIALFDELAKEYSRIMYITTGENPDYLWRRELRWLNDNFMKLEGRGYSGGTQLEIHLYEIPRPPQ
jgi:hypothetical protein